MGSKEGASGSLNVERNQRQSMNHHQPETRRNRMKGTEKEQARERRERERVKERVVDMLS